jgi:predicted  nucleic acid-binding Zn-ribbon protein
MMDEQGTRFEVLLEDMKTHLSVVAESNHALAAALADMKADSSRRFDEIDVKLVGMTIEMRDLKAEVGTLGGKVDKLEGKVDKLEAFASDAGPRLVRLEGKVDKLEAFANDAAPRLVRLEGKVDKVEAFASDAAPRLVRIETHLALPAPRPRREIKPSKHHRRKPTKRN